MMRAALLCLGLMVSAAVTAQDAELDPVSGLKMRGDWELVRNNCSACHSTRLITQQSGTADQWLGLIRWMQAEQNLWPFDPDTESRIIAYLAENYPPAAQQRRAPLPAEQMPPRRHYGCRHGEGEDRRCRHRGAGDRR